MQEECRRCAGGVQGVQAAMHGVLASVQGGVRKVQVPCTPCTDGSIISGAGSAGTPQVCSIIVSPHKFLIK